MSSGGIVTIGVWIIVDRMAVQRFVRGESNRT